MKARALEEEIVALRKEVEQLRQQKVDTDTQSKSNKNKAKSSAKVTAKNAETLETELKKVITEVLAQAKKDYDNLSPVTALLLFALGAMLGGVLARSKGGR